ncbi:MAG: MFS transporter [Thermodesulfobacteriota bacterium]
MKKIHYGWVIVGVGLLVTMAALGFGRFAYAMLLSNMRNSLEFDYIQMGFLSGGILLGYLLFSFISGALTTEFGAKRIVVSSLLCSSISMFILSRLSGFISLLFFTFAMGGAAAGAHISMTTLPMAWFEKRKLGRALGVVTGGTGLGIIGTGLILPYFLSTLGREAWRQCWAFLSLITLMVAMMGLILLKEKPGQTILLSSISAEDRDSLPLEVKRNGLTLKAIILIYFIFGFAYNIYATYFVAFMVEEVQLTGKVAGLIWSIFGWMCVASGLVWGFLSDRFGRRKALLWNNALISLAVVIPLLFHRPFFLGISTFLFGFTFLGTVTIIAACVGDLVVEKRASAYGLVTLIHGIGQLLGTTLGGYLKDLTGAFQSTLLSSLMGFLFCVVLILFSKERD